MTIQINFKPYNYFFVVQVVIVPVKKIGIRKLATLLNISSTVSLHFLSDEAILTEV